MNLEEITKRIEEIEPIALLCDKRKRTYNIKLNEVKVLNRRISTFEQQMKTEQRQLERLDKFTLANFIATISGTKYDKLTKEKQEYWAAREQYESLLVELELTIQARDESKLAWDQSIAFETEYQQLLSQKRDLLIETIPEVTQYYDTYQSELQQLEKERLDIQEAQTEGKKALNHIHTALEYLDKAKFWYRSDRNDGGLITASMKSDRLNTAISSIHQTRSCLRRMVRELEDIPNSNVMINKSLHLTPFEHDEFILFMKNSRVIDNIKHNINILSRKRGSIASVMSKLKQLEREKDKQIRNLTRDFEEFIQAYE